MQISTTGKKFLILQMRPEDETADSEFAAILRCGELDKVEVRRVRVDQTGFPEINLDDYCAIIAGGSPFDISTSEEEKDSKQKETEAGFKKLFDHVVKKDFPFLGACSGCGLLGDYTGAKISEKFAEPVAGVDITLTEEGKKDPLLEGLPETFRALAGHKEACDGTPPGAVLLASSAACPVHMFRIGENVYATQFHPEADAAEFTLRINIYKHHGYFPPEDAEKLIATIAQEDTPVPKEILKRFVERFRKD